MSSSDREKKYSAEEYKTAETNGKALGSFVGESVSLVSDKESLPDGVYYKTGSGHRLASAVPRPQIKTCTIMVKMNGKFSPYHLASDHDGFHICNALTKVHFFNPIPGKTFKTIDDLKKELKITLRLDDYLKTKAGEAPLPRPPSR